MEKQIILSEKEYNELVRAKSKWSCSIMVWEDGQRVYASPTFYGEETEISRQIIEYMKAWDNRQGIVNAIYSRNLWQRIFNKHVSS